MSTGKAGFDQDEAALEQVRKSNDSKISRSKTATATNINEPNAGPTRKTVSGEAAMAHAKISQAAAIGTSPGLKRRQPGQ